MKHEQDHLDQKLQQFPRYKMNEASRKEIHDMLTNKSDSRTNQRRERKNKWGVGIASIAALTLLVVLGMSLFQGDLLQMAGDKDENNEELNDTNDDDETKQEERLDIRELSDKIIVALNKRDMQTVAEHVDPEKGLIFSPYVYIDESVQVFNKSDVSSMLDNEEIFVWGDYDGKGTPIELTPTEYFDEFLDVKPQLNPDDVLVDEFTVRGNTINNILDVFPDATVIEYYHEGSEEYAGIDWSSINLVYEQDDETGALQLVAIVRDEWTI